MLTSPQLPSSVKLKIFEYIEEKSAGLYGDGKAGLKKFAARVPEKLINRLYFPDASVALGSATLELWRIM